MTTQKQVIKALEKSITHWERMRDQWPYLQEAPYSEDCALCHLFLHKNDSCAGCPIAESGRGNQRYECTFKIYKQAANVLMEAPHTNTKLSKSKRAKVNAMINFLKGLLVRAQKAYKKE